MNLPVEKVFVIHYTRLPERRKFIEQQLSRFGIQAEFITKYDREELTPEALRGWYDPNPTSWHQKVAPLWNIREHGFRHLNPAEISCTVKHLEAIRRIGEECSDYGLIFEDDAILCDNFVEHFSACLKETPADWEGIMVGCCCDLHAPGIQPGKRAYRVSHPATRGLECYLLRKHTAQAIWKRALPFQLVSDWEVAAHLSAIQARMYWWEPPLTVQGSVTGVFKSELR